MKRVLYIGPSPERIGGVSSHIQRLSWLLRDIYEFDYIDEARGRVDGYYNIRDFNLLTYFRKIKAADIIHVHSGVFILRLIHIICVKLLFRKPLVVSIHHELAVEGKITITRFLLRQCDFVILDSQSIYSSVYVNNSKCIYKAMPAFLPPIEENEPSLPDYVVKWIRAARTKEDAVIMCSSSSNIGTYNGVELYGNDMNLDAVKRLNSQHDKKRFYLILILHNTDKEPDTFKKYKDIIENDLRDHVLLITSPISFLNVMKESDIVLRPTNTDGDSITVREALYLSKAMVASDCAARPEGTIVFKTRDLEDYCDKIIYASHINESKEKDSQFDYKSFFVDIYENSSCIRK